MEKGKNVTKKEYANIKRMIKTGTPAVEITKKCGRCESTVRKVRNTKNYEEYTLRNIKYELTQRKRKQALAKMAQRKERRSIWQIFKKH